MTLTFQMNVESTMKIDRKGRCQYKLEWMETVDHSILNQTSPNWLLREMVEKYGTLKVPEEERNEIFGYLSDLDFEIVEADDSEEGLSLEAIKVVSPHMLMLIHMDDVREDEEINFSVYFEHTEFDNEGGQTYNWNWGKKIDSLRCFKKETL